MKIDSKKNGILDKMEELIKPNNLMKQKCVHNFTQNCTVPWNLVPS